MTIMFVLPALLVQADQPKGGDEAKAESTCCLQGECPTAAAKYCACGNCEEGCDCCEAEECTCKGCTCSGCVSDGKKSDLHAAWVSIAALMKADCCQSGKCALPGKTCGCETCQTGCKCCGMEKCDCKTCSCAKCKDPKVGAHAVATVSCGCGSCEAGCGCCSGEKCECKGCTCSGCVSSKDMHMVLVSKTSNACCKTGGKCAHGHHGKACKCGSSDDQALPETPVLND